MSLEFILLFALSAIGAIFLVGLLFRQIRRYGAYAYANARINAMKSNLFRDKELDPLIQSRNLQNLISILGDSPYSPYLESMEELTPEKIEKSFQQHLVESHEKISKLAPEEIREIFIEMRKIHEIKNIKTILTGKLIGAPPDKIEEKLLPRKLISEKIYEKAIEAEDIERAAAAFEETDYWDRIDEALTQFEESGNILSLWSELEQKYWRKIWEMARDSGAKYSEIIQEAVGIKIDIQNILTVLRCKAEEVEPEKIEKLILKIYSNIESQTLERAIESKNTEESIAALEDSPYGKALSEVQNEYEETQSVFPLEKALEEFFLQKLRTLSIQHYTGVGPLITFFHEKNTEAKNLTTITNGKSEELGSEKIKEKIIAPEAEW